MTVKMKNMGQSGGSASESCINESDRFESFAVAAVDGVVDDLHCSNTLILDLFLDGRIFFCELRFAIIAFWFH